jgi:hypothetical protein
MGPLTARRHSDSNLEQPQNKSAVNIIVLNQDAFIGAAEHGPRFKTRPARPERKKSFEPAARLATVAVAAEWPVP